MRLTTAPAGSICWNWINRNKKKGFGLAGEADVHIYAEEIAFHVSREFLSVHCASGGQRKIRLPFQAERITEIFEGRVIAGNTDTFSDFFASPGTNIYFIERKGS